MKSILTFNSNKTGWSSVLDDSDLLVKEPIFTLHLTQPSKPTPKRSTYHISPPNLLEISEEGCVECFLDLNLVIFEAFTEDSPTGKKFGFFIGLQVFYTDSESDLEMCAKLFREVCIFTNIEEEYVLIKEIGKGSTATVYLAQDLDKKNSFAVKCIHKSNLIKRQSLRNLQNEICIMRQLDHPAICKLLAVYEDNEQVYLVMEYLPHGNLLKRVTENGALTEEKVLKFMKSLLETLEYLHSRDIVHRDLKLENILMKSASGEDFKIIDLGLAYNSRSMQMKKCGSPGYVAPEMLRDEGYDYKIDIFSAGVILYILLHGEHPFEGKNLEKILSRNLECHIKVGKQVSTLASHVIHLMMQPFPELRLGAKQLLEHPWFNQRSKLLNVPSIVTVSSNLPINN